MNRAQFINTCSKGCIAIVGGLTLLPGCGSTQYFAAQLVGSDMLIPVSAFEIEKNGSTSFKRYVIAHNDKLQYPICVYRNAANEYKALLMRCTHQGTELQVFGDRLQCPAHGSEFSSTGSVKNGPAETPLRAFPVSIENARLPDGQENLKISLT